MRLVLLVVALVFGLFLGSVTLAHHPSPDPSPSVAPIRELEGA